MKIDIDDSRDAVDVISVSGRVDSNTSPELTDTLTERAGRKKHMVLDLHEVDYMSSAGVRALVSTLRICDRHRRKLLLANLSARVADVLDLAGLRSIFEVYDSKGAALGVLNLND